MKKEKFLHIGPLSQRQHTRSLVVSRAMLSIRPITKLNITQIMTSYWFAEITFLTHQHQIITNSSNFVHVVNMFDVIFNFNY